MKKLLLTLSLTALMSAILLNPAIYITSVKSALNNCYATLIPSLFVFMLLSQLFCDSAAGTAAVKLILPLTRKLFKMNVTETKITLLSFLGGYPCGAKLISNALKNSQLSEKSATRLLRFCVNPSPSYLILALGTSLYQNKEIGVIILTSNITVSLLTALITRPKTVSSETKYPQISFSQTLIKSTSDSTNAMLLICAFSLLFSVIITFLNQIGLFKINRYLTALISLSLDVVTGVNQSYSASFFLTATAVSFGGVSVILQCMAILKDTNINFIKIIPSRILTSLLTGLVSCFIIRIRDFPIETMTTLKPELSTSNPMLSVFFIITSLMFVVSLKRRGYNDQKTFWKQN